MKKSEEKNNSDSEEQEPKRKLWKFWLVILVINIGFIAILVRLFVLQVIESDKYRQIATQQSQSKVVLRPERGSIYDRNGKLIAGTIQCISIAVDPSIIKEKEQDKDPYKAKAKDLKKLEDLNKFCYMLEQITKVPAQQYLQKINASNASFLWLARGIIPEEMQNLAKFSARWLIKITEPRRHFLYDNAGAQVVGITNIDNRGLSGIEAVYDSLLSGTSGYIIMQRDGKGRLHPSADLPVFPAIHGQTIQLTIDIELQRIVEYELAEGIARTGAESGTIISMEPQSGEILAMASWPTFNPNSMSELTTASLRNRAITDVYEPGSTFKTFIAAAALEEGLINPSTKVNGYGGQLNLGTITIRDDHAMGVVPFREAYENSSNIVFSSVGNSIPDKKFYKYLRDFGFGTTLGIDMKGEVAGKLKKTNEFVQNSKRFMSFGYGIMATPLQVVNAFAVVANKGTMMRPHIVRSIYGTNDQPKKNDLQKIRRVVSEKTTATLTEMMCGVVDYGTGKQASIEGLRVAGKTGTTKQVVGGSYSDQFYTASFGGFVPADNPKIAMLVTLDRPRGTYYGGSTAAPVFREIAMRYLSAINYPLIDKNKLKAKKPGRDSLIIPDLRGLKISDAENYLRSAGFAVRKPKADAIVYSQQPPCGTIVSSGKEITLLAEKANTDSTTAGQQKPSVLGLHLRRAVYILHSHGIRTQVHGTGKVKNQEFFYDSKKQLWCKLTCG